MECFDITMSDMSLKSLTRRIEEKLLQGYELVTKVKRVDESGYAFTLGSSKKHEGTQTLFNSKWKVVMRKIK